MRAVGLLASYECAACGYRTKELTLGPGPDRATFDPTLVSCPSCKTLRVVDARAVPAGCAAHRKPFVVHEDEQHPPCPRCGTPLTQNPSALWD